MSIVRYMSLWIPYYLSLLLWLTFTKKMKAMNGEVTCPICIIKQYQHVGSELSFISDRLTSTKDHYIHQIIHQIIPNTIHHFRIKEFESFLNPTMRYDPSNMDQYESPNDLPFALECLGKMSKSCSKES